MRLRITWIIVGLLTAIVLSNLIAIYNIIKLFIFNRSKIKSAVISTTTQKYGNSYRTSTKIHVTTEYRQISSLVTASSTAVDTEATTLKHRRRYKFDKKLGKYVRIRKPELERTTEQSVASFTHSATEPIWNEEEQEVVSGSLENGASDYHHTASKEVYRKEKISSDVAAGTSDLSDLLDSTGTGAAALPIAIPSSESATSVSNTSPNNTVAEKTTAAAAATTTTTTTTVTTSTTATTTFETTESSTLSRMIPPLYKPYSYQQEQQQLFTLTTTMYPLSSPPILSSSSLSLSSLLLPTSLSPPPLPSSSSSLLSSSSSSSPSLSLPSLLLPTSLSSPSLPSSSSSLLSSPSSLLPPPPPPPPLTSRLPSTKRYPNFPEIVIEPSDSGDNSNPLEELLNNDIFVIENAVEDSGVLQTKHSTAHQSDSNSVEVRTRPIPEVLQRTPTPLLPSSSTTMTTITTSTRTVAHPRLIFPEQTPRAKGTTDSPERVPDTEKPIETVQQATNLPPGITLSGFTLVTALLDIGRGDWWEYRRPMESYYNFMENILRLKVNLVIFVDQKSVEHVYSRRKVYGLEHITKVIPITLSELPLYRYMDAISDIISSEQSGERWDPHWDRVMSTHPEAKSAEYDILVNSKPFFLHNASVNNPFSSEYFAWLDAGYAHGNQSVFPPTFHWHPSLVPQKISLIKVTPSYDSVFRYTLADLYRKNWAVISGGFLGGDIYSLNRFHQFYYHVVVDMIHRRLIDDDQTTLVLLIQQQPALFNVVHGDWFDAFRLFS